MIPETETVVEDVEELCVPVSAEVMAALEAYVIYGHESARHGAVVGNPPGVMCVNVTFGRVKFELAA